MKVVKRFFEDAGDKDADGNYDYYYAGISYSFVFPECSFLGMCYHFDPTEAYIIGRTFDSEDKANPPFPVIPYDNVQFREVALYLRDTEGFLCVKIGIHSSSSGYVPLTFSRFGNEYDTPNFGKEFVGDVDFRCFQCQAPIKHGEQKCPACGWSWT
jgi:hypothetical protein